MIVNNLLSILYTQQISNINNFCGSQTYTVRLKVESHKIHEIQFLEVTNYRNPRNTPPIGQNPHAKKAKSNTGHEIHCNTPKS